MEKYQIGIDEAGRGEIIGSLFICGVKLSRKQVEEIHRKYPFKNPKNLKFKTRYDRYKYLEAQVDYRITKVSPWEFNCEHIDSIETKYFLRTLNQFKEFWNDEVIIDNPMATKVTFFKELNKHKTTNLKKIDLKENKWKVIHGADKKYKVAVIAGLIAWGHHIDEMLDIQKVWSLEGVGAGNDDKTLRFIAENPTCPHIKKTATYKRIMDELKDGGYYKRKQFYNELIEIAKEHL